MCLSPTSRWLVQPSPGQLRLHSCNSWPKSRKHQCTRKGIATQTQKGLLACLLSLEHSYTAQQMALGVPLLAGSQSGTTCSGMFFASKQGGIQTERQGCNIECTPIEGLSRWLGLPTLNCPACRRLHVSCMQRMWAAIWSPGDRWPVLTDRLYLEGFFGVYMLGLHEPARLIRSDRNGTEVISGHGVQEHAL